MMDVSKDITEFKKEWYRKAEEDSKNLFAIAEDAIARDPKLNVVIVKRLRRFDRASKDILGIKTNISKFANHVYDQLWLKQGSPTRIHIIELELGCDKSQYLKDIIYGEPNYPQYDGVHLVGPAAVRHFTYRAVQKLASIITKPSQPSFPAAHKYDHAKFRAGKNDRNSPKTRGHQDGHTDCEQARYQHQSASGSHGVKRSSRTYSDVVRNEDNRYNVPTNNTYAPLNC